jgi:DNA-binding response OmpR family regulator
MTTASQASVIMVVDPAQSDYEPLVAAGETSGIRFRFLSTVEEALRLHPPPRVLAWIINMALPPLSGLELYGLLRSRLGGVPVLIVDDQYDAARELSVLTRGGPHYLCKPLEASWIDHLRHEARN